MSGIGTGRDKKRVHYSSRSTFCRAFWGEFIFVGTMVIITATYLCELERALSLCVKDHSNKPKTSGHIYVTKSSDISNNTTDKELIKNDNLLVKVIEVEYQSMRSTDTKVIDVVIQEVLLRTYPMSGGLQCNSFMKSCV